MQVFYNVNSEGAKIVAATHDDLQIVGATIYGPNCLKLSLPNSVSLNPGDTISTLSSDELTVAINAECQNRIFSKVSQNTQTNIAYESLNLLAQSTLTGTPLTDAQKQIIQLAAAIKSWITNTDNTGMIGCCRAMIASGDADFQEDSKWAPWDANNEGWNTFIAQF